MKRWSRKNVKMSFLFLPLCRDDLLKALWKKSNISVLTHPNLDFIQTMAHWLVVAVLGRMWAAETHEETW